MSDNLALGEGLPVAAAGVESWQKESRQGGWLPLSESDRYEFRRAAAAPYLIRENALDDICYEPRTGRLRGARRLVIVFRSGTQMRWGEGPGWHALSRAILAAEAELTNCPALGADAKGTRTVPGQEWFVSCLISNFVYVAAPGGMTLCYWGARIHDDFQAKEMTHLSRLTVGLFQRSVDKRRRFLRDRMKFYPDILHFPLSLIAAKRLRRRDLAH